MNIQHFLIRSKYTAFRNFTNPVNAIKSGLWLLPLILFLNGSAQFYSGSQMEFGKNRIQYRSFDWSFFRYERFDVYFYAGGKEIALNIAAEAGRYLPELEQRFDYGIENRIQILIFNRLSDLKQTNLGTGAESLQSLGGTVRQSGNKIFLCMEDGNSLILKHLREGFASVMASELLMGTDFKDKIRSSAFMFVPEWYFKGLVSWIAEGWNSHADRQLWDGLQSGRYRYPGRLKGDEAVNAGRSIWNYIVSVYGEKIIADMLDMTHVSRNIEGGFKFVLGLQMKEVILEWKQYYKRHFAETDSMFSDPDQDRIFFRAKPHTRITKVRISADGRNIAWVENKQGRVTVKRAMTGIRKPEKIIKLGTRLPDIADYSFPLIAWHPGNEILVYTDEFKGRMRLNFYHTTRGETDRKFLEFFTKITGIDISPDGRYILMTAIKNGNSDLFIFNNVSNTIEQITDDGFDEADARWFPDGQTIIFSSNRNTDSLKTKRKPSFSNSSPSHDLFIHAPGKSKLTCIQLSHTPSIDERNPVPIDNLRWIFLSNRNGISNRFLGETDSSISHIDTLIHYRYFMRELPLSNQRVNIYETDYSVSGVSDLIQRSGRSVLVHQTSTIQPYPDRIPVTTWGKTLQESIIPAIKKPFEEIPAQGRIRKIVVFGKDRQQDPIKFVTERSPSDSIKSPRQRVYFTSWYTDRFSTKIDRAYLNQSYQPYTGQTGFMNPPLNGMFRFGLADLFEDYRLTAGVRLAGNFSGNEYLLAFQDQKNRLDKTYSFHRQSIQNNQPDDARLLVHTLSSGISWPFSPIARISGSLAYRNDRKIFLATDLSSLRKPTETIHWVQPKLEYVFDNTFPISQNMMSGTRLKVTSEFFFRTGSQRTTAGIIGADLRHYIRLARETIFAIRVAGAGSFGSGKILFFLGGVDNWLNPVSEQGIAIDESQAYVFQTLATNMRGFRQNIRNGNNFGVINAECRWNPVRFFSRYPVKSDFLNALQLLSFFDMGTAFTGPNPWSEKNSFNQTTIQNGPVKVILKNLNNPVVYGTGLGLRARIFGYFVRFDYARGILNGQLQARMYYLSLCTDF
jgi:hypothetical protein